MFDKIYKVIVIILLSFIAYNVNSHVTGNVRVEPIDITVICNDHESDLIEKSSTVSTATRLLLESFK